MAKYVLLAFDNDAEADKFVDIVVQDREVIAWSVGQDVTEAVPLPATVRAVYKKPTQFCHCVRGKRDGFTRGKKYGWWVCDKCHKPTKAWAEGDQWYTSLGRNLLPVSMDAPEWRGDGKRGHVWDEERKDWVPVSL
jgi:hypothetical protein